MTFQLAIHTCTPHVLLNTYSPMANIGIDCCHIDKLRSFLIQYFLWSSQ